MKDASPATEPTTVYLKDYAPFPFVIRQVALTFRLAPKATRVISRLTMAPDRLVQGGQVDLRLDGEGLRLISLKINGTELWLTPDETGLAIPATLIPPGEFVLETEVEIAPEENLSCEGLYMSGGMYCTQCEAQGFRHITFYPDRPDVMAPFKVRIESDMPVLLSNGNPGASGAGWAEWHDPWPKPAYLFALVAGDLRVHRDGFLTASGRMVELGVWVRPGDETRCDYAMDSLIRSMRWDEEVYGREYDLDVFNIVAVDDFNMGAMENKGLNIFNSKLVLASPQTATDDDYGRIEAVIAHEYFHNWTGNRITCRDWFQLCLKEGLTVFRDHQFTGDMRSHAVKRIEDVMALRARQFREDQGPLAHPVRPDSFIEINNFYTATVYEKGSEVIAMLKLLVGDAGYAKALDLYFTRHDGDAATIEDWLQVFEDATGRDLTQFKLWYTEAGTPRVTVEEDWADGVFTLTLAQVNPPTPGQADKAPKVIPVAVGLLNPNGDEVRGTQVLELTEARQSFRFEGLAARPVASVLRGFSAPVVLERQVAAQERAFLLAHDSDPFNRWEAGRELGRAVLAGQAEAALWVQGMAELARDQGLDPAFRALALRLPGDDEMAAMIAGQGGVPDPEAIRDRRRGLQLALAEALREALPAMTQALGGDFAPSAEQAGARALRLAALGLMGRLDLAAVALAHAGAGNMTEEVGTLAILLENGGGAAEVAAFEARWQGDRLVMDKWFALQVACAAPDAVAGVVERLTAHPLFDWKNPNRFRSVIGALSANHAGFHHGSGSGYRLLADWLLRLDPINPQTAARMSTAFETWGRYDAGRQALARGELERITGADGLSRDLGEMASRMLGRMMGRMLG